MKKDNAKTKKRYILLLFLVLILISLVKYLYDGELDENNFEASATSPMEITEDQANALLENPKKVDKESIEPLADSLQPINRDLDVFFISLSKERDSKQASSAASAKVIAATNVRPPDLSFPVSHGGGVNRGIPTGQNMPMPPPRSMITQPVAMFQNILFNGIACSAGECKASTSIGILAKGNVIGGGAYTAERIEAVTMSGIKTDKRFLTY